MSAAGGRPGHGDLLGHAARGKDERELHQVGHVQTDAVANLGLKTLRRGRQLLCYVPYR